MYMTFAITVIGKHYKMQCQTVILCTYIHQLAKPIQKVLYKKKCKREWSFSLNNQNSIQIDVCLKQQLCGPFCKMVILLVGYLGNYRYLIYYQMLAPTIGWVIVYWKYVRFDQLQSLRLYH